MGIRRPNQGGRKNLCKFPSFKNQRSILCESILEKDCCLLFESDPTILSYTEQPLKIEYLLDDKYHSYTPDILIQYKDRRVIIEVKPYEKTLKADFILRTKCIRPILEKDGYSYVIMTEREIRMQPRFDNIKFLFKYSATRLNYGHQIFLYDCFRSREYATLRELEEIFRSTGMARQIVMALIYRGYLSIDIHKTITPDVYAWLPGNNDNKIGGNIDEIPDQEGSAA